MTDMEVKKKKSNSTSFYCKTLFNDVFSINEQTFDIWTKDKEN